VIKLLRITGILMIAAGCLLAASWFIEPLRALWPALLALPLPVRIGLLISALGLLIVFGTVVHERFDSDPDSTRENLGGRQ